MLSPLASKEATELITPILWSQGLKITNCYRTKRSYEGNRNQGVDRGPLVSSLGALTLAKAFIFPFAYIIIIIIYYNIINIISIYIYIINII